MVHKKNWKEFERIVAAIHIAETKGATVVWDEQIKGRQFDVTIRFKQGLYDYLTIIECKKYTSRVLVDKVDAFATKTRDANANKSIIISSSDFQSGCIEVAERHNIELFTLTKKIQIPEDLIGNTQEPRLDIRNIILRLDGNKTYTLSEENGILEYLVIHSHLFNSNKIYRLGDIIAQNIYDNFPDEFNLPKKQIIDLEGDDKWFIDVPNEFNKKRIYSIQFSYEKILARSYSGPPFDPHQIHKIHTIYELFDVVRNKVNTIDSLGLPLGFDTIFETGKFYVNPSLGANYFCERIDNNIAHLLLVESYQFGTLVQASVTQEIQYQNLYVEILDRKEIKRLTKIYKKIK